MTVALKIGQPRFLRREEIQTIQDLSLAEYGGLTGEREPGLLDSAIAQAAAGLGSQYAHDFPFGMAAAYAFHIARNHPFLDGNKRTAFGAAVLFLHLNGWELEAPPEHATRLMVSLAGGAVDKAFVAEWFESAARPRPSYELRDFFRATTMESLLETLGAMSRGERPVELGATMTEAAEAIPLIGWLVTAADEAAAAGDEAQARTWRDYVLLLAALCRAAENAGYDW